MAASLFARARFMAGLLLRVAGRALPRGRRASLPAENPEALIEALMTGDIATLDARGPGLAHASEARGIPWFFIALETGSLSAVQWFLSHGASPTAPDRTGRLPLEAVIQRSALADEFDDHREDCPAMAAALIAAGANPGTRNLQGQPLADLARTAGLHLPQAAPATPPPPSPPHKGEG